MFSKELEMVKEMNQIFKNLIEESDLSETLIKSDGLPNGKTVYLLKSNKKYFVAIGKDRKYDKVSEFGKFSEEANRRYVKVIDSAWECL